MTLISRIRQAALPGVLSALLLPGALQAQQMPPLNETTGLDNPTLALNLTAHADYMPGMQFIDIMKMMRSWKAMGGSGEKKKMDWYALKEGGFLDAQGWPTAIPPGFERIRGYWEWNSLPEEAERHQTRYVLRYEGEGELEVAGDVAIVNRAPGQITFDNRSGRTFFLNIIETDPRRTGDNLRNITIVAERDLPMYEAGVVFNPDWVKLVADARQLRFMDWNATNNSSLRSWEDRLRPEGLWPFGVPLEMQVRLANEVGADPWFNVPHMADADYIRQMALYVRDHVDPDLTVRVEYSNEAWNWSFEQTRWMRAQSEALWGVDAPVDFHAKKAVETARIWEEVFAEAGGLPVPALVNVLGTHTINTHLTRTLLDAAQWRAAEPEAFIPPAEVFEELAVTHYFGNGTLRDDTLRGELLAAIRDPAVDAEEMMARNLMTPDYSRSIPQIAEKWKETAQIAHEAGLGLVAYEGGQHLHAAIRRKWMDKEDAERTRNFLIDFVRSPLMADLYAASWAAWEEVGDGPYMHFSDMTQPGQWGSWGIYESLDSVTARGARLLSLNAERAPWWGATGGPHYRQGLRIEGGPQSDVLAGSAQEDILLGGAGDDILRPGPKDDAVNGGPGTDRVLLDGPAAQYGLRREGAGYRLEGPEGSDFLVQVEELSFAGGPALDIDALRVDAEGRVALEPR